jgi:hypothetical protein
MAKRGWTSGTGRGRCRLPAPNASSSRLPCALHTGLCRRSRTSSLPPASLRRSWPPPPPPSNPPTHRCAPRTRRPWIRSGHPRISASSHPPLRKTSTPVRSLRGAAAAAPDQSSRREGERAPPPPSPRAARAAGGSLRRRCGGMVPGWVAAATRV